MGLFPGESPTMSSRASLRSRSWQRWPSASFPRASAAATAGRVPMADRPDPIRGGLVRRSFPSGGVPPRTRPEFSGDCFACVPSYFLAGHWAGKSRQIPACLPEKYGRSCVLPVKVRQIAGIWPV